MVKKIRGYSQPGRQTTGASGPKKKRNPPKPKIVLYQTWDMDRTPIFAWEYSTGGWVRAHSPRMWYRLSDASRNARAFREHLANADAIEIVPPPDYKYSGG